MHEIIFNLHDVILLTTFGMAVLVALPLLYRRRNASDMLLAGFVLSQGFLALYYLFLYSPVLRPHTLALLMPFQIVPLLVLFTLQGLLLFWYTRSMVGESYEIGRGLFTGIAFLWGLPVAIIVVMWLKTGWVGIESAFDGITLTFPVAIVSLVYGVRAILTLSNHDKRLREYYSNIDDKSLEWLTYAAVAFVGVWLLRIAGYFAGLAGHYKVADLLSTVANFPAMVLIGWMVILGLSQQTVVSAPAGRDSANGDSPKSVNEDALRRLEDLMVRVRVYQDPELNREGLADSLGVSPRSLSSLINGHYGMNFYDFVNQYRVQEAREKLADPGNANVTVQRIFEDAGFNSKSTFNTLFKKATGKTPSEFRRHPGTSAEPV